MTPSETGYFGGFKVWARNTVIETHARLKAQARRRKRGGRFLPYSLTNCSFLPLRLNRIGERRVRPTGRRDAAVVLGRRCASATDTTTMHAIDTDGDRDEQTDDHHQRSGPDPVYSCTRCGVIIPETSTTVDGGRECRRCGHVERPDAGGVSA